jgi:hypothetical protein
VDKSLESALNNDLVEEKPIEKEEQVEEKDDLESEDNYESELEEIYTAYTSQFIRDKDYHLFEKLAQSKRGLNVGKFGRF